MDGGVQQKKFFQELSNTISIGIAASSAQYAFSPPVVLYSRLNLPPWYMQIGGMVKNEDSGAFSDVVHRHDHSVASLSGTLQRSQQNALINKLCRSNAFKTRQVERYQHPRYTSHFFSHHQRVCLKSRRFITSFRKFHAILSAEKLHKFVHETSFSVRLKLQELNFLKLQHF